MASRVDFKLETELQDVFGVTQLTRGSPIEAAVGADLVTMEPGQASQTHRHNFSETVLYFLEGEATVFVNDTPHLMHSGHRILIRRAEYHSVSTGNKQGCKFLSVQTPPILNSTTGFRDLEERK